MQISVIIPTYKPQAYIYECLSSLITQTIDKSLFEVIVILNGCREPYYSQLQEFIANKMSGVNVNLLQTDTPGVSNARNVGLDAASGQYVTFIDDDDYVSPAYLQQLYAKAAPDTISLCYPYAFNDGEPDIQLPYSITRAYDKWSNKFPVRLSSTVRKYFSGPCMKLIPMSFIHERRFDPAYRNGEDSLFMFLISDRFDKYAFTDKSAVYYRRYRSGSAYTSHRTRWTIIINSLSMICEYSKIYFKDISHYNFEFYFTRILASLRSIKI
jgi:glycosyltransferase involved in cell wall biosynthesis